MSIDRSNWPTPNAYCECEALARPTGTLFRWCALEAALERPRPALPAPEFSETIQRAVDVFRDGTEESLGEWRMREGRVFVDELTRLVERAALPAPEER